MAMILASICIYTYILLGLYLKRVKFAIVLLTLILGYIVSYHIRCLERAILISVISVLISIFLGALLAAYPFVLILGDIGWYASYQFVREVAVLGFLVLIPLTVIGAFIGSYYFE